MCATQVRFIDGSYEKCSDIIFLSAFKADYTFRSLHPQLWNTHTHMRVRSRNRNSLCDGQPKRMANIYINLESPFTEIFFRFFFLLSLSIGIPLSCLQIYSAKSKTVVGSTFTHLEIFIRLGVVRIDCLGVSFPIIDRRVLHENHFLPGNLRLF